MSLASKIARNHHFPLSICEVDCSQDSIDVGLDCYSTPDLNVVMSPSPIPVQDFKQSLENQKNIRKYINKLESLDPSDSLGNEKILQVLERNYKLQIQTLLEEVNQLKLDKKILEKKMERLSNGHQAGKKSRAESFSELSGDDTILKRTLEAKDSTIKELEFQVSQLKSENTNLKTRLESQSKQKEEFFQRVADSENLKVVLEEKDEELANLKASLETAEMRHDKILKEVTYLRNENIALKLGARCFSCGQPQTGATSFANPQGGWGSKDASFLSSMEKCGHYRNGSDGKFSTKILNLSDLDGEQKVGGSPSHSTIPSKILTLSSHRTKDSSEENIEKPKGGEPSGLQDLSMKVLNEYEQNIKLKNKNDVKKDPKALDRIIEVNKIKSYVIEAQNKKLLLLLNSPKAEK